VHSKRSRATEPAEGSRTEFGKAAVLSSPLSEAGEGAREASARRAEAEAL